MSIVIVGGGIGGVSCCENLSHLLPLHHDIVLISATSTVKAVTNVVQVSKTLVDFSVQNQTSESFAILYPRVTVLKKIVEKIDSVTKKIHLDDGSILEYSFLVIATGGKPKNLLTGSDLVVTLRDRESVERFQHKLSQCKRICVIGNGGIATELVYEISNCEVIWIVKHSNISHTFLDPGASKFFLSVLQSTGSSEKKSRTCPSRHQTGYVYEQKSDALGWCIIDSNQSQSKTQFQNIHGSALGPDWSTNTFLVGSLQEDDQRKIQVEYETVLSSILTRDQFLDERRSLTTPDDYQEYEDAQWPIYIKLMNGKLFGCDLIVNATGVLPSVETFTNGNNFEVAEDGGICVDEFMRTSIPDVFAVGDACTAKWDFSRHWFQMRLWSQARTMGIRAARSIASILEGDDPSADFSFELFAHMTRFFGFKVILLGLHNAQCLGNDYNLLLRVTQGKEYVKCVMQNGRMQGALLIGDTDLEETFENLILNQMDISAVADNLLDPNIDVEDYFD